jgi:hypothetical protein
MGIGTSNGAYFEDDFQHQAGVETPTEEDKASAISIKPVTENTPEAGPSVMDKLLGTNGQERHQLWPERMVRDAFKAVHGVSTGQIPMWTVDPETGDFHTSEEGLAAAQSLMPFALSGAIPTVVHLRGEGVEALSAGRVPARVREIPPEPPRPPASPREFEQQPFDFGDMPTPESFAEHAPKERFSEEIKDAIDEAKKGDKPALIKDYDQSLGNMHKFYFADKNGVGEIKLIMKGKNAHVSWIGSIKGMGKAVEYDQPYGYQNFGPSAMRSLIKQLKEKLPDAETISGFRISGARGKSGKTDDAKMRLR